MWDVSSSYIVFVFHDSNYTTITTYLPPSAFLLFSRTEQKLIICVAYFDTDE